jgi:uncharacterized membrane protein
MIESDTFIWLSIVATMFSSFALGACMAGLLAIWLHVRSKKGKDNVD